MEREFFECTNMHFYDVCLHPKSYQVSLGEMIFKTQHSNNIFVAEMKSI